MMYLISLIKLIIIFLFFYFFYIFQTLKYVLTYLGPIEEILILPCHYFDIHYEKVNLYTLINFYLLTKNQ